MQLSDFDYELPAELIAQRPLEKRDAARMLVLERGGGRLENRNFRELPELLAGNELIVFNNTRVIPARLFGRRKGVHAHRPGQHSRPRAEHLQSPIEVLLTRPCGEEEWDALVRPGRKVRVGERIFFGGGEIEAEVTGRGGYGQRRLRFIGVEDLLGQLDRFGHVPLPPYIARADEPADREWYQTVFASRPGAVAAPTAGLHFSPNVLARLQARGIETCEITVHIGPGTFQPIRTEEIENHRMQSEAYEIPVEVAERIHRAREARRPILAVGTSVVRALEDAAKRPETHGGTAGRIPPGAGEAELFICPGHCFRMVDQLLTNFHLPRSSLLVLVSAFAGRERILAAYGHAVERQYRFYSYGDCMWIR